MKALEYGITFAILACAAFYSASPKQYIDHLRTKEDMAAFQQATLVDRQKFPAMSLSYNNDLITLVLGLGAGYFLVRLGMSLDNNPIVQQPAKPQQIREPSSQMQPFEINNNIKNVVFSRSPQTKAQSPETYTPDRVKNQDKFAWLKKIFGTNCLMIFGSQGSGKTSFVEWYAKRKAEMGHEVIILDPHKKYGAWEGLCVVGGGRDYDAVNKELTRLDTKISERYIDYDQLADFNPRPITVICEEFTKWKSKCSNADPFFETSLTDIRKVGIQVVFVAHTKTMSGLTGQKGLSDTFKTGVDMLELITETIECADGLERPRPSGKGNLKLTGDPKSFVVDIPSYDRQKAIGNDSDEELGEKSIADQLNDLFPDFASEQLDNVIPINRIGEQQNVKFSS